MNWNRWADFVAMGGYGFYVWGSFGMAAAGLLLEMWLLVLRRARLREAQATQIPNREWPHETQA